MQWCQELILAEGVVEKISFHIIQKTETNRVLLDGERDGQTVQHRPHWEKYTMNLILSCLPSLWEVRVAIHRYERV